MKSFLVTFFLIILVSFLGAQGSIPVWLKDYSWGGNRDDYLMDIHQNEKDLSIFSAGHTFTSSNQDVSSYNKGYSDYWVVKTDSVGVLIYEQTYGGDSLDNLAAVVPTFDDGYLLAGSSASGRNGDKADDSNGGFDYWIVKIDKEGNPEWNKTFGGLEDDILTCAAGSEDGGFYLGGYSSSEKSGDKSQNSYGAQDFWMIKLDSVGGLLWDLTLGGDSTDVMKSIIIDEEYILVGGYSISKSKGTKSENGFGGYDFWVNKVDFQGGLISDKTLGGPENDFLEEIRLKEHSPGYWISGTTYSRPGGIKTSGYFNNGDTWVLKVDSSFLIEFDRTIGSHNYEKCMDMEISPEGSAIIAARSNGLGGNKISDTKGVQDYWIYKIDTVGNIYWDKSYGGLLEDSLEAIFIKCDRGILAGGCSKSSISGDRTHLNKGENDFWVVELSIPTRPWFNIENVCARKPLTFYDQSDLWPNSHKWNFDDPFSANNNSFDKDVVHTYTQPGTYNVTLTVKEGCQASAALTREIVIYENTVFGNVDLGRGRSVCGNEVEILNEHKNAPLDVSYLWSTGESTESIFVKKTGVYELTISDDKCSDFASVIVDTCPDFGIPMAFSPNGDDFNDVFKVYGVGFNEFELLIYNRWGEIVYQTNNQYEGWDGKKNGNPCQIDVYVYKIIYRGLGLSQKQKVGQVSLIR